MGADQHFFTCVCVCTRASPAAPHAEGLIVFIRNGALQYNVDPPPEVGEKKTGAPIKFLGSRGILSRN